MFNLNDSSWEKSKFSELGAAQNRLEVIICHAVLLLLGKIIIKCKEMLFIIWLKEVIIKYFRKE